MFVHLGCPGFVLRGTCNILLSESTGTLEALQQRPSESIGVL